MSPLWKAAGSRSEIGPGYAAQWKRTHKKSAIFLLTEFYSTGHLNVGQFFTL